MIAHGAHGCSGRIGPRVANSSPVTILRADRRCGLDRRDSEDVPGPCAPTGAEGDHKCVRSPPKTRKTLPKNPISSHAQNADSAMGRDPHLLALSSDPVCTARSGRAGNGRGMGAHEGARASRPDFAVFLKPHDAADATDARIRALPDGQWSVVSCQSELTLLTQESPHCPRC